MAKINNSHYKDVLDTWKLINGKWVKQSGKQIKATKQKKAEKKKPSANTVLKNRLKSCRKRTNERINSTPSVGEEKIINFLKENNIHFIREYYNPKLFNEETGNMLYFDFYVPTYNLLIEFDGIHHFKPVYGEEKLRQQKAKDKIKDRWCAKRNWPLLRISCFEMKDLEAIICKAFDKLDPIT